VSDFPARGAAPAAETPRPAETPYRRSDKVGSGEVSEKQKGRARRTRGRPFPFELETEAGSWQLTSHFLRRFMSALRFRSRDDLAVQMRGHLFVVRELHVIRAAAAGR